MLFEFFLRLSGFCMELAAAGIALYTYKYYRYSVNWLLLPFLWIIVFLDGMSYIPALNYFFPGNVIDFFWKKLPDRFYNENMWITNVIALISALFYVYYFRCFFEEKRFKAIGNLLIVMVIIGSVYGFLREPDYTKVYINFNNIIQSCCIIIAAFTFLFQTLSSEEIDFSRYRLPFYVALGCMFFYTISRVAAIFSKTLNFSEVYVYILVPCIYLLYGAIILGFLLNVRKKEDIV